MKKEIYIIDAHAYIHRAFHAIPYLSTSKGVEVNAVFGFLRLIFKIVSEKKPDYLAVCFDYPAPTFRHKMFPDYKATRKEIDPSLKKQLPLTREVVEKLGFPVYEKSGFEADDVIGTIARQANDKGLKAVIVTGDKDSMQLVNKDTVIFNDTKNTVWDDKKIKLEYGIKPEQFIDMYALAGDSSDNVPGVRGVGDKTALKLIQEYGDYRNVFKNLDNVKGKLKERLAEGRDSAVMSYDLVKISCDVPVELDLEYSKAALPSAEGEALKLLKEYEFNSLIKELKPAAAAGTPKNVDYKIIDSDVEMESLAAEIEKRKIFVFDLETDSLDVLSARIVGISFSFEKGSAYYLPFIGSGKTLSRKYFDKSFGRIFADEKIKKIGHNLKFDYKVLKANGIQIRGLYFDTMIASYLADPTGASHGLKDLAFNYFHASMTNLEDIIDTSGDSVLPVDKLDVKIMGNYSCADSDYTWQLYEVFSGKIAELEDLMYNVEMPVVGILADMELAGINVDIMFLERLSDEFKENLDRLEAEIYKHAGQEFNINSPKQLSFILFEKLKLPAMKKTKTGYSTNEAVLSELRSAHPLPDSILEYRENQKLKSTYVDAIIEKINRKTGRLHASFNQAVTATGRLSSSEPNLQNIPIRKEVGRKIRRAFIAEKGKVFISADYSQIDLRSLAHISGDHVLIDAFKNNEDIHTRTASEIFKVPLDKVSSEQRDSAKAINFGIVYGQQAFGLARSLGIGVREADDYINSYFKRYSGVKSWIDNNILKAKKDGAVRTISNRIRFVNELDAKNMQVRAAAERLATNTPIQGSSADIIKVAMVKVTNELAKRSMKAKLLVQVHDDLLLEVPESEVDEVKKILVKEMEHAVKLKVPLKVSMKVGNNWGEMN